jgi:hypothetical protein
MQQWPLQRGNQHFRLRVTFNFQTHDASKHGRIHTKRRQTPLSPRRRQTSKLICSRRSPLRSHGHVIC